MPTLTAADGAKFFALIEEMPDGQWRASAKTQLDRKSSIDEQTSGIEMFQSETAAREWVDKAGEALGFKTAKLEVKRLRS